MSRHRPPRLRTLPLRIIYARSYSSRAVVRGSRGGYDSAMPDEDDIAFQRAILANPADTTLKLVYADWLQERADPRAEFVRLQVQLSGMVDQGSAGQLVEWLSAKGSSLDPAWVAFMTTLAQPFEPITVLNEE